MKIIELNWLSEAGDRCRAVVVAASVEAARAMVGTEPIADSRWERAAILGESQEQAPRVVAEEMP